LALGANLVILEKSNNNLQHLSSKNTPIYKRNFKEGFMKIISSFGLKGGIGKTTSVINYASALSFLGYKVLIIDVDHNASINKLLSSEIGVSNNNLFITDLLLDNSLEPNQYIRQHKGFTCVKKIPKTPINIDYIPSDRLENEVFDQKLLAKRLDFKKEKLFEELILKIQDDKNYDYIIFDVSPESNTLTKLALYSSDGVIINSKLSKYENAYSIDETLTCLREFSACIYRNIKILGIQFNAMRTNVVTEYNRYKEAKLIYKETVFEPIPVSIVISELLKNTVFEAPLATDLIAVYLKNTKEILANLK
jgi:chromosome partitioning protein